MAYWLMKTEPDVCSFDDIWKSPKRTTGWDGVRNYQARNFMRDQMRPGDGVFVYHSNADPAGIAGIGEVASEPYADPTQFDPKDAHFDPAAKREAPTWVQVDIKAVRKLPRFVALEELRGNPRLAGMRLLQRGNRLSITPVTAVEWRAILSMAER